MYRFPTTSSLLLLSRTLSLQLDLIGLPRLDWCTREFLFLERDRPQPLYSVCPSSLFRLRTLSDLGNNDQNFYFPGTRYALTLRRLRLRPEVGYRSLLCLRSQDIVVARFKKVVSPRSSSAKGPRRSVLGSAGCETKTGTHWTPSPWSTQVSLKTEFLDTLLFVSNNIYLLLMLLVLHDIIIGGRSVTGFVKYH